MSLVSTVASAQQVGALFDLSLDELMQMTTHTASLRTQPAPLAPSKVMVFDKRDIQQRNYRYLADLLADLPATRLSLYAASPDSGSSQLIVRGISGNNKLVLMWNGQRLNHPDAQPLHITPYLYPLSQIKQVEVVYGSASSLYGSDTVAMTINLIADEQVSEVALSAEYGRYSSHRVNLGYQQQWGDTNFSAQLDDFQTHGVDFSGFEAFYSRYPTAPGVNADFDVYPASDRAAYYHPSERGRTLRVRAKHKALSFQGYHQVLQTQTQLGWSPIIYEADDAAGRYEYEQWGVFMTYDGKISDRLSSHFQWERTRNVLDPESHWSRPNQSPFREYSQSLAPRGIGTRTYKLNYGNKTRLEQRIKWQQGSWHWINGVSHARFELMPKSANLDVPGDYSDLPGQDDTAEIRDFYILKEKNTGVFSQLQWTPSPDWQLTFGLRYDDHSRYGAELNHKLALNWSSDTFFSKWIVGSSFLAPAPLFIYDTFLVPRVAQQVPNLDLKPEQTRNLEWNIGTRWHRYLLEASFYYTRVDDLILQRQLKSVELLSDAQGDYLFTTTHSINAGQTRIKGMTLETSALTQHRFSPYASYNWTQGKTTDMSNQGLSYSLIHMPKHQVKFGIDSQWLDNRLTLYGQWQWTGRAKWHPDNYRFPARDNGGSAFSMPSYSVLKLGGSYAVTPSLRFTFEVSNVGDKAYWQPIDGQETSDFVRVAATPGIPRQFYLGIQWSPGRQAESP